MANATDVWSRVWSRDWSRVWFALSGDEVVLHDGCTGRGRWELPDGVLLKESVVVLLLLLVEVLRLLRTLLAHSWLRVIQYHVDLLHV